MERRFYRRLEDGRRGFLRAGLGGLVASLGAASALAATTTRKAVFQQDLPQVAMDGWQVTAVELTIPPGAGSQKHRHPGFVLGYVLEGELKFQVEGQPETVIPAGQMFYEPPGSVHAVSASASPTKPVRFLAMVLAEKGKPTSSPA